MSDYNPYYRTYICQKCKSFVEHNHIYFAKCCNCGKIIYLPRIMTHKIEEPKVCKPYNNNDYYKMSLGDYLEKYLPDDVKETFERQNFEISPFSPNKPFNCEIFDMWFKNVHEIYEKYKKNLIYCDGIRYLHHAIASRNVNSKIYNIYLEHQKTLIDDIKKSNLPYNIQNTFYNSIMTKHRGRTQNYADYPIPITEIDSDYDRGFNTLNFPLTENENINDNYSFPSLEIGVPDVYDKVFPLIESSKFFKHIFYANGKIYIYLNYPKITDKYERWLSYIPIVIPIRQFDYLFSLDVEHKWKNKKHNYYIIPEVLTVFGKKKGEKQNVYYPK